MVGKYDLSVTEREIMEVLWEHGDYMRTGELFKLFNERGKNWKRQTLNTLLIRLDEIGVVTRRRAEVTAAFSKAKYCQLQTQDILDKMYGGELSNFVAALTGRDKLNKTEAAKLEKLIAELDK